MDDQVKPAETSGSKSSDEVSLELMKFIASATGYGRGTQAVGFSGKSAKTPEEQVDSLLELFERCRGVVNQKS